MRFLLTVAFLLLSGCGSANDPVAGGVSPSEAQALNDAAEMLDQTEPSPTVLGSTAPNGSALPKR